MPCVRGDQERRERRSGSGGSSGWGGGGGLVSPVRQTSYSTWTVLLDIDGTGTVIVLFVLCYCTTVGPAWGKKEYCIWKGHRTLCPI